MNDQSIHQSYTEDHQHLRQLFERFQSLKTTDQSEAKKVFKQFRSELERHILWEERILFPCFDNKYANLKCSPIPALNREHQQILVYLEDITLKLAREDFGTEEEEAIIEMALREHNQKEEEEVFPALDKVLTGPERAAIHAAMSKGI